MSSQAQQLLERVDKVSSKYGQEISETKTEWMLFATTPEQVAKDRIDNGIMLRVKKLLHEEKFKYLGSTITTNENCSTDIRVRTATALKVMGELDHIWKNKNISKETKIRLYKSLIVPIALYGCETWTLRKTEEKQIMVFEMAALRRILGVHIMDKMRNEHIREALNMAETIIQQVHKRQHRWLGHVLRMNENRIAKTTLHGRIEGTKRRGRPRTTWLNSVLARYEHNTQELMETAQERNRWNSLMSTNARAYVDVH